MNRLRQYACHAPPTRLPLTRLGISLAEVLVAFAVVTLLMAMLLPALQSSREAARSIQCKNNLHQLALGVTEFESVQRRLPQPAFLNGVESPFIELLPYVGATSVFMTYKSRDRAAFDDSDFVRSRPSTLACPADPVVQRNTLGLSYGVNEGWLIDESGEIKTSGVFGRGKKRIRLLSEVTDGLSNTCLIGEILPGEQGSVSRSVWLDRPALAVVTPDTASADCLGSASVWSDVNRAARWTLGVGIATSCDHILPPNSRSCVYVQTVASPHRSGVHLATCDGAVRFVSEAIDLNTWRAMGTRQGSETAF